MAMGALVVLQQLGGWHCWALQCYVQSYSLEIKHKPLGAEDPMRFTSRWISPNHPQGR